jgi:hypothetical protein
MIIGVIMTNRWLFIGLLATLVGCQNTMPNTFADLTVQSLADGDYYLHGMEYSTLSNNISDRPEVLLRKQGETVIGWAADEGVECFQWVIKSDTEVEVTEYYPESQEHSTPTMMNNKLSDLYQQMGQQADLSTFTRDNQIVFCKIAKPSFGPK